MTKSEFLEKLNLLLWDLPEEERTDAVRYYEDYLADAGPEMEETVLAELGSPERVAEKIHLRESGPVETGEYTEHGYVEPGEEEKGYPVPRRRKSFKEEPKEEPYESHDSYDSYETHDYRSGSSRGVKILAAVLLIVFVGLPFVFPIVLSILAVLFAVLVAFISLGIGGGAMIAVGVTCIGTGISVAAASSGMAMLVCGVGLMVAAIGLLLIVASVNCGVLTKRAMVGLVRGVTSLTHQLFFGRGRGHETV